MIKEFAVRKRDYIILSSHQQCMRSPVVQLSPHQVSTFYSSPFFLVGKIVVSPCAFIYIALITTMVSIFLHMPLGHLYLFIFKWLNNSFIHFKLDYLVYSIIELLKFFTFSGYKSLIMYIFEIISFQSIICLFMYFLKCPLLPNVDFFYFDKAQLINYFFLKCLGLCCHYKIKFTAWFKKHKGFLVRVQKAGLPMIRVPEFTSWLTDSCLASVYSQGLFSMQVLAEWWQALSGLFL